MPPAPSAITPAKDDVSISPDGKSPRPEFRIVDRLGVLPVSDLEVRIVFDALAIDLQKPFRDADEETLAHQ